MKFQANDWQSPSHYKCCNVRFRFWAKEKEDEAIGAFSEGQGLDGGLSNCANGDWSDMC